MKIKIKKIGEEIPKEIYKTLGAVPLGMLIKLLQLKEVDKPAIIGHLQMTEEAVKFNLKILRNEDILTIKEDLPNIYTWTFLLEPVTPELSKIAQTIFNYWKLTLKHPRSIYDNQRKKKIIARLKEGFSEVDLLNAIGGVLKSPWHLGENPTRTRYDGIDTIFRSAEQVEHFISLLHPPEKSKKISASPCPFCAAHDKAPQTKPPCKTHHASQFWQFHEKKYGKKNISP